MTIRTASFEGTDIFEPYLKTVERMPDATPQEILESTGAYKKLMPYIIPDGLQPTTITNNLPRYEGWRMSGGSWVPGFDNNFGLPRTARHGPFTNATLIEQFKVASEVLGVTKVDCAHTMYETWGVPERAIAAVEHGCQRGVKVFSASLAMGRGMDDSGEWFYEAMGQILETYGAIFVGWRGNQEIDSYGPYIIKCKQTTDENQTQKPSTGIEFISDKFGPASGVIAGVSGQLAALWSLKPTLTPEQLIAEVSEYCTQTPWMSDVIYGEIDFHQALLGFSKETPPDVLPLEERVSELEKRVGLLEAQ